MRRDVWIRLTDTQVERVVSRSPVLCWWFAEVKDVLKARARAAYRDKAPSRQIIDGWILLASVPADGYFDFKDVAGELGCSQALGQRHLMTLVDIGVLERHPDFALYRHAQRPPAGDGLASG